jgi:threonine dehydrogenase-like Zn-dependent dehydrogenase
MKFLVAFVALAALAHDAAAFAPMLGAGRSTALRMNVETPPEQKIIKVGVIGAGRIGLVHLEAITKAPGVIPVIISNPTISKAENGELARSWRVTVT